PGGLREDLRHRLSGGVIRLEPLASRPEDLWPLAEQFAAALERTLSEHTRSVLERHSWPGNARELRQVIARAAVLQGEGPLAGAALLEALDLGAPNSSQPPGASMPSNGVGRRTELAELCRIHEYDSARLMGVLGVSRTTLYR